MPHDLFPFIIPALATVVVAWISTRGGKRTAEKAEPFKAQEHGEHAHTRDVIHWEAQRIMDRIDRSDTARGLARQSDQIGISVERNQERAVRSRPKRILGKRGDGE